jgi:hypothetical protein
MGQLQDNLTRAGADIEGATAFLAGYEAEGVFDEGVVNFIEVGLGGRGGIGFDLGGVLHHFGFRDAREIE